MFARPHFAHKKLVNAPASRADAIVNSFVAAATLGGHRIVRATATGEVVYADNIEVNASNDHPIGMTLHAAVLGADVLVQAFGIVDEGSWAWNPALGPLFLGTVGALTQTPPTSGFNLQVGIVLSPTRILVNLHLPVILS